MSNSTLAHLRMPKTKTQQILSELFHNTTTIIMHWLSSLQDESRTDFFESECVVLLYFYRGNKH